MHIHSVILFVLSKCVPGITRVWQSHASLCFMLLYACLCSSVCHHLLPLPVCRHVWWLWSWFYHVSGWALDGHHREETDLWQVRQWGKSSVSLNLQTNASIIIWSVKKLLYSWYKALLTFKPMLILIIKEEKWMKKRNLIGYDRCSNIQINIVWSPYIKCRKLERTSWNVMFSDNEHVCWGSLHHHNDGALLGLHRTYLQWLFL